MVAAYYGIPGTTGKSCDEDAIPAHMQVFKDTHDPTKIARSPKFSINLETSQVCTLRPSPSPIRKERVRSSKSLRFCCSFCITTQDGACYEFRALDEIECQLWINILKFLIIFPYSCIPQQPKYDCTVFESTLDPNLYGAGKYSHTLGHECVVE